MDIIAECRSKTSKAKVFNTLPGNSFFEINKVINGLPVMVKIDGNRQITAYVYSIRYVEILIEDLNHQKELGIDVKDIDELY